MKYPNRIYQNDLYDLVMQIFDHQMFTLGFLSDLKILDIYPTKNLLIDIQILKKKYKITRQIQSDQKSNNFQPTVPKIQKF